MTLFSRFATVTIRIPAALLIAMTAVSGLISLQARAADAPKQTVIASGLENPESVVQGADGKLYVTVIGKDGTDGDGSVAIIEDGNAKPFATGLDDPKGLVAHGKNLYVADKTRVWKIDPTGKASVHVAPEDFPQKPKFLNDIEVGPGGDIYVSDCGTFVSDGAVYRITPDKKTSVVLSQKTAPGLKAANGLLADGPDHLLVADFTAGKLHRLTLADGKLTEIAKGLGGTDGIARDSKGNIYVSDWKGGRVFVIEANTSTTKLLLDKFKAAADLLFLPKEGVLLVPDMKAGTITSVSIAP